MRLRSQMGNAAIVRLVAVTCALSAGCGMAGEMLKDPTSIQSTAKLGQEPVPLPVVVRRADVAAATAAQVDRLLVSTPVDATSTWPKQTQLSSDDVKAAQKQLAEHPYYDQTKWSIVPAEVWASALASIKSDAGQNPSLLAAISSDLSAGYANVIAKIAEVAALEAKRKAEEDARDKKDVSDADKKAHQAAADMLGPQIDAAKKEIETARKSFEASCQAAAAKVPADVRTSYSPAVANLRRAVHDAKVANTVALARYPFVAARLAMQIAQNPMSLKEDLISAAKGSASDVLFEQVGKRVKIGMPDVKFDKENVDVTLNGLALDDLGKLSLEQLMTETTLRTGKFVAEALTLPLVIASTQEKLDFEADVLDRIKDGFSASGGSVGAPAEVSIQTSAEIRAGATSSNGKSFNPFKLGN